MQAIIGSKKWFLLVSPHNVGSANDDWTFLETQLYQDAVTLQEELEQGFWLAADSAYSLHTFMMIPFLNTQFGLDEENINLWLSNSRIHLKCAFGDFILCWGNFGRN